MTGRFSQPTGPSMIDLQALDRGEDIDRAPIAAGAVVIEDEHQIISSAVARLARCGCHAAARTSRGIPGGLVGDVLPNAGGVAFADTGEEVAHLVEARLVGHRGVDDLGERARTGRAQQRPRRNEVGEVERRDRHLLRLLHHRRGADGEVRAERPAAQRDPAPAMRGTELRRPCLPAIRGPASDQRGARAGRADIAQVRAALDQQARDQQFGALVARKRDAAA